MARTVEAEVTLYRGTADAPGATAGLLDSLSRKLTAVIADGATHRIRIAVRREDFQDGGQPWSRLTATAYVDTGLPVDWPGGKRG